MIPVVGLGLGELTASAQATVNEAQVLVGGRRQLAAFPDHPAEKIPVTGPLETVFARLGQRVEAGFRVVVLADGDPLFFGLGARLVATFGRQRLRFYPAVSSLQAVCARLGRPWHDVASVSLHGRDHAAPLCAAVTWNPWVLVLTDGRQTPATIARLLLERKCDRHQLHVAENLGLPDERLRHLSLEEAAGADFADLNVVVVERLRPVELPLRLGLADNALEREAGLMTKGPVRAAVLAALSPADGDVVWDIGAGSGALSLEAAALARSGQVYAVERVAARLAQIGENIRRTGAHSVAVVAGAAPECLTHLPDPHRICLGGGLSGPQRADLLATACGRLRPGGRLVASVILLESLHLCRRMAAELGWPCQISQVAVNRCAPLAGDLRLVGDNPTFLISLQKPESMY